MNVVCIGAGYVGTVTAASFADSGHNTTLIDIDREKIAKINSLELPFFEPGLSCLITKHLNSRLTITTSYEAVSMADVIFIAVGTPSSPNGCADITYIKLAAKTIAEHLSPERFTVIANKSTVPVGTGELVTDIIAKVSGLSEKHFVVVSNPEFLREGSALEDVFKPDRIVVGSNNAHAIDIMYNLYKKQLECSPDSIYFTTDVRSAELIKYVSNAFLAVKISYANEVAQLSDHIGANVTDVIEGMGLDKRIGNKFLSVSNGWGGSCFKKDTSELLVKSAALDCQFSIVKAAVEVNKKMPLYCLNKLKQSLAGLDFTSSTVGVLGLTFKPNTDDVRETQSEIFIRELLKLGFNVNAHDPKGIEMFQKIHSDLSITYCKSILELFQDTSGVILLTHWSEYANIDWSKVKLLMKNAYVLDTRNFLDRDHLINLGFSYDGIGIKC